MTRARLVRLLILLAVVGAVVVAYLRRPVETERILTGIVDGNDVAVSPETTARIASLRVREGDRVLAGDVVATLNQDELLAAVQAAAAAAEQARLNELASWDQLQLLDASIPPAIVQAEEQARQARAHGAQAQTALALAEANLQRIDPLFTQGLATAQQRDDARAARESAAAGLQAAERSVAAAEAALESARAQRGQIPLQRRQAEAFKAAQAQAEAARKQAKARFDRTELTAPVTGVVSLLVAREGEVVNAGSPIVTIFQNDDTWVQAYVPETYAETIALGQMLKVRLPSGGELAGPVVHKAVEAEYATLRDTSGTRNDIKTVGIRVRVPNSDGRLVRGMTASVILPLAQPSGK